MVYSRKNPHPHATEGMLENRAGGGVNSSGNSAEGGALNLTIHRAFWVSRQHGH